MYLTFLGMNVIYFWSHIKSLHWSSQLVKRQILPILTIYFLRVNSGLIDLFAFSMIPPTDFFAYENGF